MVVNVRSSKANGFLTGQSAIGHEKLPEKFDDNGNCVGMDDFIIL